jgi:hypothetical protein
MGINFRCKLNMVITLDILHRLSFVKRSISKMRTIYFTGVKERKCFS